MEFNGEDSCPEFTPPPHIVGVLNGKGDGRGRGKGIREGEGNKGRGKEEGRRRWKRKEKGSEKRRIGREGKREDFKHTPLDIGHEI